MCDGGILMSKPKILNLTVDELVMIARALNENTLANKKRILSEKISTDIFLKQKFNINRKDFSESIKSTQIKYNRSTFLYDIPGEHKSVTKMLSCKVIENIKIESTAKPKPFKGTLDEVSIANVLPSGLFEIADMTQEIKEIVSWYTEFKGNEGVIKELLEWYKHSKSTETIIEVPQITLNKSRLHGEIKSRSFKLYENVLNEFKNYCEKHNEFKQQDLLSMALLEYMDKYKQ